MKKITSVIIALVVALSMITASAEVPAFLTESYNNYSADYSFTLSFEGSDELVALLDETGFSEEASRYVDLKALLESLLSTGAVMNLQADISEDFKKIELALTSDMDYAVTVNKNLDITLDMKTGMWLKIDLSSENPVFKMIYSHPFLNKYMVMDLFEMVESEEEKAQIISVLEKVFNKEYIESINDLSAELLDKYAKITIKGATCVVKLDNEGLMGMLSEIFPVIMEKIEELMPITPEATADMGIIGGVDGETEIFVTASESEIENAFSALKDIQILGKDGITYTYSLFSGKISRAEVTADISFDISKLVTAISGEAWQYQSKGVIDFLVKSEMKISKIGSTKVAFPTLTEENSFSYMDTIPQYEDYDDEFYYEEYPYPYVWAYSDTLPVIDGEYYVPLRNIFEDAYGDKVTIDYKKGNLTISSDYFDGFTTLSLTVDSEDAYTDGVLWKIPKVIVSNGMTYVGTSLFVDIFGWELGDIIHNITGGYFEINFYTY